MKRYIVSGSILLALSWACEDKKRSVKRDGSVRAKATTEVTSSPEINLPSVTSNASEPQSADSSKPISKSTGATAMENTQRPIESETISLAAKTIPNPTVKYEDVTARDLAEGSANEVKDEGLARIRERALIRAREQEEEAAALAIADEEAEQARRLAQETEAAPAPEGSKVAMVSPSDAVQATEATDETKATSIASKTEIPTPDPPLPDPVRIEQNLDRKTTNTLASKFHKAMSLVKKGKIEEAKNEFLSVCQSGYAHACHKFAWYEVQAGNHSNAVRFYHAACENGLGKACNNLAFQFEQMKNFDKALELYAKGCMDKHEASCQSLRRVRDEQKIDGLKTR